MKLDFVCIGAQKAGTTTLHDILNTHPDIYLPPKKEAQFFDINERYEKGLEWYFKTFFNTYKGESIVGNINPNLQIQNRSLGRLKKCFGDDLKIILIMRNPVKRAYSHYLMSKRRGLEKLSFIDALYEEERRFKNPMFYPNYISNELGHYEVNHFGYAYRSHYSTTIEYLLANFPQENIHLILFEDFIQRREDQIKEILEFLGLQNSDYMEFDVRSNVASAPQSILLRNFVHQPGKLIKSFGRLFPQEHKEFIKRIINNLNNKPLNENMKKLSAEESSLIFGTFFKDEVHKLETLTGLDLKIWKC